MHLRNSLSLSKAGLTFQLILAPVALCLASASSEILFFLKTLNTTEYFYGWNELCFIES